MKGRESFKVNYLDVEPDRTLRQSQGWVNMTLRWVITEKNMGSKFGVLGYTVFPPGSRPASHVHKNAEEYIMVTKGHGIASSGEQEFEVGPGDVTFIPRGKKHYTKNTGAKEPLEIWFVYAGKPSLEKAGYEPIS